MYINILYIIIYCFDRSLLSIGLTSVFARFTSARQPPSGRGHQEHLVELDLLLGRPAVCELNKAVAVSLGAVEDRDIVSWKGEREGILYQDYEDHRSRLLVDYQIFAEVRQRCF